MGENQTCRRSLMRANEIYKSFIFHSKIEAAAFCMFPKRSSEPPEDYQCIPSLICDMCDESQYLEQFNASSDEVNEDLAEALVNFAAMSIFDFFPFDDPRSHLPVWLKLTHRKSSSGAFCVNIPALWKYAVRQLKNTLGDGNVSTNLCL